MVKRVFRNLFAPGVEGIRAVVAGQKAVTIRVTGIQAEEAALLIDLVADKASVDNPATDKVIVVDNLATDKVIVVDNPVADRATVDNPVVDNPVADRATVDNPMGLTPGKNGLLVKKGTGTKPFFCFYQYPHSS